MGAYFSQSGSPIYSGAGQTLEGSACETRLTQTKKAVVAAGFIGLVLGGSIGIFATGVLLGKKGS